MKNIRHLQSALVLFLLLLGACVVPPGAIDEPSAPNAGESPATALPSGRAVVEQVEILLLESFPVQVQVVLQGYLTDGCTTIEAIEPTYDPESQTFFLSIDTDRPANAACPQVISEFQETVMLDVLGLPAGTYTVDVQGTQATFTLEVDNMLSEPGSSDLGTDPAQAPTVGLAPVEEVRVQLLESQPVQVELLVSGYLPDGCTQIGLVRQFLELDARRVRVELYTVRSGDACTDAIVSFEKRISAPAAGLPAGAYTVTVNGVEASFTLESDNVATADPPALPSGGEDVEWGLAPVDRVAVLLTESTPVQVHVDVSGYLPDGCTTIAEIVQVRDLEQGTFSIEIRTVRPKGAMCTQVISEFQETIALDVAGLPAGDYTVNVNGVSAGFGLTVDQAP